MSSVVFRISLDKYDCTKLSIIFLQLSNHFTVIVHTQFNNLPKQCSMKKRRKLDYISSFNAKM